MVELTLAPSATRVFGTVTLNGKPFTQAEVEFTPVDSSKPVASGAIDSRGSYELELPKPGVYVATLRLRYVPIGGQQKSVEVGPGGSRFDWAVVGGTLAVRLENVQLGAAGGRIQIDIQQIEPAVSDGRPGLTRMLQSDAPELQANAIEFSGMAFGTYTVRASQRPARDGILLASSGPSTRMSSSCTGQKCPC
jgi:hypothetical protein